jgi:hypothetical protein
LTFWREEKMDENFWRGVEVCGQISLGISGALNIWRADEIKQIRFT